MSDELTEARLKGLAEDIHAIKLMMAKVIIAITDAESEIPEKMRRFIMYMHDVHDIVHLYTENGQSAPDHVLREMERCDDRYRQLLTELHLDGGTFEKVRREMAKDAENRWDHTRQLTRRKPDETGNGNKQQDGIDQG